MTTPDGEDAAMLVARHSGARALDLGVVATQTRTPAVRRLRLGGEGLADLDVQPGQALMVEVPADGFDHFRRRYTIRHLDRESSAVDLDVILHGDGPGARWARTARSGDRVGAVGPRGKIRLADGAARVAVEEADLISRFSRRSPGECFRLSGTPSHCRS